MTHEIDFDETLRAFLGDKAERGTEAAPSLELAVGRLAPRLERHGGVSSRLLLVATAAFLVAMAGSAIAVGTGWLRLPAVEPPVVPSFEPIAVSNGWIAYSSSPGDGAEQAPSDVFIVREGSEPIRISSSSGSLTINVCPVFSPDGTKLAYGTGSEPDHAIVIVEIRPDGSLADAKRLPIPGPMARRQAPCPRWSGDGSQVAYLGTQRILALGLDGSSVEPSGDLEAADFARLPDGPLLSPDREWVARLDDCVIDLVAAEGSERQQIRPVICPYALGTWAPDSSGILYMTDVGGSDFALRMAVMDPERTEVSFGLVRVHDMRSWPGNGDVSWQPVYR